MRYRKLDQGGDYSFGKEQANFYRDQPEGPAQAVVTRLRLLAGEWFVDLTEGTPYQGGVFGKHTKDTYDPIIRARILGTEGVTSILDYASIFDGETRKLTVSVTIDTAYGPATIMETL